MIAKVDGFTDGESSTITFNGREHVGWSFGEYSEAVDFHANTPGSKLYAWKCVGKENWLIERNTFEPAVMFVVIENALDLPAQLDMDDFDDEEE